MSYDIDKGIGVPDGLSAVVEVCDFFRDNRLKVGESVFVADFPIEHLTVLTASLLTYNLVPIYTRADSVYGGAGVRIHSLTDVKGLAGTLNRSERIEARRDGDWTANRKGSPIWDKRASEWFGFDVTKAKFAWANGKVIVVHDELPADSYEIDRHSAFAYMTSYGEHYRNGATEPRPLADTPARDINVWVGFKQVVWGYSATENAVIQFADRATQDADMAKHGGAANFEDAPLYGWLAYQAAKAYNEASEYNVEDL